MQKLQRSTFSATQKDSLLDQVKLIIDAGEVDVRSDSLHLDSTEITRYTRAIDRLNAQYGWHLDAQKVLSRLGKKLGKKCGGGWISPEKKCKSHYTNGKLNASGKASGENLADRVRRRKNMSTIASRDGKLAGGSWDIGAAYRPGSETQSSVQARRTSPGGKKTSPMTDRASKMQRVEADRARINWGRTTGDWKQQPDSTAAMDMERPKSTKGAAYLQDPRTNNNMRNHDGVKKIVEAIDFNGGLVDTGSHSTGSMANHDGSYRSMGTSGSGAIRIGIVRVKKLNPPSKDNKLGSATVEVDYGGKYGKQTRNMPLGQLADGVRQTDRESKGLPGRYSSVPTPIEAGKSLKSLFAEADRVGAKYQDQPQTLAERRAAKQGADRIMEESGARAAVDRASGVATLRDQRTNKTIDPARTPVRIPNQRSSSEPRRRGRSVD